MRVGVVSCLLTVGSTACYTEMPTCGSSATEVEDTDVSGIGLSAAELLARAEGTRTFDGVLENDEGVTVIVEISRRVGPAVLVEAWPDVDRQWSPASAGVTRYLPDVSCEDYVEVPVALHVGTTDGAVSVAATGGLRSSLEGVADESFGYGMVDEDGLTILPMPEAYDAARYASTKSSVRVWFEASSERGAVLTEGVDENGVAVEGAQVVEWFEAGD